VRFLHIAISLVVTAFSSVASPACLEGYPSISSEVRKSQAVFIGVVLAERVVPANSDNLDGTVYSIRVEEVLRGSLPPRVEIFSENSSGRFPMTKGTKYLLFVHRAQAQLSVDNCGNSGPLPEKAEVLAEVRRLVGNKSEYQKPNPRVESDAPRSHARLTRTR
jgi:hypothetical protein